MKKSAALLREQARAAGIQQWLCALIAQANDDSSTHDGTIRMLLADAWEELRLRPTAMSVQDLDTLGNELNRFELRKALLGNRARQCEHLLKEPYFARVDFREAGADTPESLLIGLYSLLDAEGKGIICDWRAPAAGLYYDAVPGSASYEAPGGCIEGELLLKRQYRFDDGVLTYFVDTDVAIEDGMLMDILSGATSSHMRSIVSTIQREQNRAIRCEGGRVLSVIGGAGTGKTSVAMHRAAFLMYRHRNLLHAESIAALSPTSAFSEYISGVLPDLGEQNAQMPVLRQLYTRVIGIAPEPPLRQIERLSQASYSLRRDSVGQKSGPDFIALMNNYIDQFAATGPNFRDLRANSHMIATRESIEDLYRREFGALNPCLRLTRIQAVLTQRLDAHAAALKSHYMVALKAQYRGRDLDNAARIAAAQSVAPARAKLKQMMHVDPLHLYACAVRDLPEDLAIAAEENALAQLIWWEDAPAIAYLMIMLGFSTPDKTIRHLLVDEAQDYPLIALRFLHALHPRAQVTLLGDPNQRTSPGMPASIPAQWASCFGERDGELIALTKCYRSTAPITRFCNALLPDGIHATPCGREGETPMLRTYDQDAFLSLIAHWIAENKRIAVITRALPKTARLTGLIPSAWLIEDEEDMMPESGGVVLSCYHLLKGLEFDAVAVIWPDVPLDDNERRRLYTASSRALHNLALFAEPALIRALNIIL